MQATGYDDEVRSRWSELVSELNRHLSLQMARDAEAGLVAPLSDDHGAICERLTDMIVMAFLQDRSVRPAEAESARVHDLRPVRRVDRLRPGARLKQVVGELADDPVAAYRRCVAEFVGEE